MNKKLILKTTLIMTLLAIILTTGCTQIPQNNTVELSDNISIKSFQSENEFKNFLSENQYNNQYYAGFARPTMMVDSVQMADGMQESVAKDSASNTGGSSNEFSKTNVQVEGIDEADIIKTDGDHIYTSSNKDVFIIDAYPAQNAEITSEINLKNKVTGLFIQENILAVIGQVEDIDEIKDVGFSSRIDLTFLNIYDISDKKEPELIKEYKFDGTYFNAREYEGIVYLSTNYRPWQRSHPMPIIMVDGITKTMSPQDIYIYDTDYNNPSFVSIHSINLETQEQIDSKIMTLEGQNHLYMSYDNIYLTYTQITNRYELEKEITINKIQPLLPQEDKEYIQKVKSIDNDILSEEEKQSKIMQVIERYVMYLDQEERETLQEQIETEVIDELKKINYLEHTVIHKINADDGKLNFIAGAKIPGSVYGQFALDEHENILRIATTINTGMQITEDYSGYDWKSRSPSTNNVYTLNENMEIIGELKEIAPTESIYSARYVDDRLYLVTFEQIDPFFVIDLSNPTNPKNLGELKITGYSRYLHPYDENTIIGLGRETTKTGRLKGLKISLFDVEDVENPKELVKYVSDDTSSSSGAEWEHKAFLFSKEKELLVIPTQNHDYSQPENNYAGAIVFKINKEEITPRGIIDHMQGQNYWEQGLERSLYIENELYTKSTNLLRINNLDTLESIKNITLTTKQNDIPVY